jgi:hypothetical protein
MAWIAYYRHGKEYRESTHSTDENHATKLLKNAASQEDGSIRCWCSIVTASR